MSNLFFLKNKLLDNTEIGLGAEVAVTLSLVKINMLVTTIIHLSRNSLCNQVVVHNCCSLLDEGSDIASQQFLHFV